MKKLIWLISTMTVLLIVGGCADTKPVVKSGAGNDNKESVLKEHGGHESGGHTHAAPHGGLVNSVGDYHTELLFDCGSGNMVLYIYGEDGKTPSAIEAKPISGQFKVENGTDFTPFTMKPVPQPADQAGMASKFELSALELSKEKTYELFLRLNIEDRSYRTAYQLTPGKPALGAKAFKCPMPEHQKMFQQPGNCPVCEMALVEAKNGVVEHSDHAPKHSGTFFMASDNWHHLEGVLASASEFRIYLYDNFTKPISAKGYDGTAEVLRQDAKGDDVGKARKLDLKPSADGTYLTVFIPPEFVTPLAFTVRVTLQKGEKPALFNFTFDKPSFN